MARRKPWRVMWVGAGGASADRPSQCSLELAIAYVRQQLGHEQVEKFDVSVYETGTIAKPAGYVLGYGTYQIEGPACVPAPPQKAVGIPSRKFIHKTMMARSAEIKRLR